MERTDALLFVHDFERSSRKSTRFGRFTVRLTIQFARGTATFVSVEFMTVSWDFYGPLTMMSIVLIDL